jgi:hypothetical protein
MHLEEGDSAHGKTSYGRARQVDTSAIPTGVDADLEQSKAAEAREHAARQAAEDELVARLRKAGFQGEEYVRFERQLVAYALKVLDAWLRHGQIFRECAALGRRADPKDWERTRLYESPEDREDLTVAVVGKAIVGFRADALVGGGWQGSKGASITTYFMNWVIREFPNQFRSWQSAEARWRRLPPARVPHELWLSDPAELIAQREVVLSEIRKLSAGQQEIIALHYDGYSNPQIAAVTGKTVKAVERTLERWRERQRHLRTRGRDGRL